MQRTGNDIWISFGPDDNDTLRYAPACGGQGKATLCRFEDGQTPPVELTAGLDILIYFNGPNSFMQQPARIVIEPSEETESAFGFETTGDAVSAEGREMFRVGVSLAEYTADVEGTARKLADVSVLGLAFFADAVYEIGTIVGVSFTVGDETFSGRCRVQSVKETGSGPRYGVLFMNGADAGNLESGLRKLTMDAQRTQLRRLSRAG